LHISDAPHPLKKSKPAQPTPDALKAKTDALENKPSPGKTVP